MKLRIALGVVLALIAGALLLWSFIQVAFYSYCEETCDKPPWSLSGALKAGLPWALAALVVLAAACYVLMRAGTSVRPRTLVVGALAIAAAAAFALVLVLVATVTNQFIALLGAPLVAVVVLGGTVYAARRLRRRAPRTG
jgi:hypothetical protein